MILVPGKPAPDAGHLEQVLRVLAGERDEAIHRRLDVRQAARSQVMVLRRDGVATARQPLADAVRGASSLPGLERGAPSVPTREVGAEHEYVRAFVFEACGHVVSLSKFSQRWRGR